MSRIGKKPIPIPKGVTVKIEGNTVAVQGPKGKAGYTRFRAEFALSSRTGTCSRFAKTIRKPPFTDWRAP